MQLKLHKALIKKIKSINSNRKGWEEKIKEIKASIITYEEMMDELKEPEDEIGIADDGSISSPADYKISCNSPSLN